MSKQILRKVFLALLCLVCLGLFMFDPGKAAAANPTTINFQGKVTNPNGTNVSDGTYTFVFRLYQNVNVGTYNPNASSCASDTNCWWEETDSISVTSGVFQVSLGATCAFSSACNSGHSGISFSSQNVLSLTMKFNGDSAGFMKPLISIQSAPYAFQADNSANSSALGGLAASNFVQLAQGVQTDSSNNSSIFINKGTSATGNLLELQKNSADIFSIGNTGATQSKSNSSSGFLVQDSSNSKIVLTVDTSADVVDVGQVSNLAGKIVFNSSSSGSVAIMAGSTSSILTITLPTAAASANNQCLVSSTGGALSFLPCGATGNTKTVTLAPEYPGAVMTHNNNSANGSSGTMTSDFCSGSGHLSIPASSNPCGSTQDFNYYSWTESSGTNDYDIWASWQAPTDFSSISSITFYGWTSSVSDATKLTVYNSGTACGNSSISTTSSSFTSTSVSTSGCTGGSAITAGSNLIFDVDLKAGVANEFARVSNIVIVYNRL